MIKHEFQRILGVDFVLSIDRQIRRRMPDLIIFPLYQAFKVQLGELPGTLLSDIRGQ